MAVSWSVTGDDLKILVKDSGPGIPEDQIKNVIEPFVRLEKSRSRQTGGNGLGLSIANSIILAHGGTLTLSNRSVGGLCASVFLPDAVVASEHLPSLQKDTQHQQAEVLTRTE